MNWLLRRMMDPDAKDATGGQEEQISEMFDNMPASVSGQEIETEGGQDDAQVMPIQQGDIPPVEPDTVPAAKMEQQAPADSSEAGESSEPAGGTEAEQTLTREQELEEQNRRLVEMLAEMSAQAMPGVAPAPAQAPAQKVEQQAQQAPIQQQPQAPQQQWQPKPYVKDAASLEETLQDPNKFNEVLGGVENNIIGSIYRAIPQLVTQIVNQQMAGAFAAKQFYSENEDLMPLQNLVAREAMLLEAQDPNLSRNPLELFRKAGTSVREKLAMVRKPNTRVAPAQTAAPAFATPPKGQAVRQATAPTLTGQEKQIADLFG